MDNINDKNGIGDEQQSVTDSIVLNSPEYQNLQLQNKTLTQICCALHLRLGGGKEVLIPLTEFGQFTGEEIVVVNESTKQRGMIVKVRPVVLSEEESEKL